MKRKDKRGLENPFFASLKYIKESQEYIYFIICIFLLFALIGYFLPVPNAIIEVIKEIIRNLVDKTSNLNTWQLVLFIFKNNFLASIAGLIFGLFLGIFPVVVSILNGYILGYVCKLSVKEGGIFSLWRLFPHGIFELPAVFISLGLGLRIGISIFSISNTVEGSDEFFKKLSEILLRSLKTFVFIVVPLLVVAAIVEGLLIKLVG